MSCILIGIFFIGVACELISVFGLHHISRINRRIEHEYREAQGIRRFSADGRPTMLLFGNSLLLEAVDIGELKQALASNYDVHRLVFEQTEYLDQYYVLRSLFRQGARPDYVVLCIAVNHLVGSDTRGEFMAPYLDVADVTKLELRQNVDATTFSSYLFAHASDWFANRGEIRKFLLGVTMPDVQQLTGVLAWRPATKLTDQEVRQAAGPRLREIKGLCDEYGSHLAILVPPVIRPDHYEVIAAIGESIGIPVLTPERPGAMSPDLFRDGFHLTPAGAQLFTSKLPPELAGLSR